MLTISDFKTADNPEQYQDEYTLSVTFRRYMSDDWAIALGNATEKRITPANPTVAAILQAQFVAELQEAYNFGGITGFFKAGEVTLAPK